jgi:hypothetical protein
MPRSLVAPSDRLEHYGGAEACGANTFATSLGQAPAIPYLPGSCYKRTLRRV